MDTTTTSTTRETELHIVRTTFSLVEIADLADVSYDRVYRDVRTGILPSERLTGCQRHDRRCLEVSLQDLSHSARPLYRQVAKDLADRYSYDVEPFPLSSTVAAKA